LAKLVWHYRPIAKRSKDATFAKQQYIGFVAVSDLLEAAYLFFY